MSDKSKEITVIKETLTKEGTFDILHYSENIQTQLDFISGKIQSCENKISSLKAKETIINNMINRTGIKIESAIDEDNQKIATMNQKYVLDYFETLSMVQEMLMKYEDLIYKYIKMRLDIENNKINAYVKLKAANKEVKKEDGEYDDMMKAMHDMFNKPKGGAGGTVGENKDMIDHVKNQLKLEGY